MLAESVDEDQIIARVAAVDVGKSELVCCVWVPGEGDRKRRLLVRVTVEVLLRTGLRVSEHTGLPADAVVQIGAAPWLHVPVGKLHEDRYLPLHPHLVTLIDDYRSAHVPDP